MRNLIGERRRDAQGVLGAYAGAGRRERIVPPAVWWFLAALALLAAASSFQRPAAHPAAVWAPARDDRHTAAYSRQVEAACEDWTRQAAPDATFSYLDRSATWVDGQGWEVFAPWREGGRQYTTRCTQAGGAQVQAVIIRG